MGDMPMPFQYFHIMNLMMMLNLSLWAYVLALEDSYFSTFIYAFVQMMFLGLRELTVSLADPFGDDDTDFPLKDWMASLYHMIYSIVEDPYDIANSRPKAGIKPLPLLPFGTSLIDFLDDLENAPDGAEDLPHESDSPTPVQKKYVRDSVAQAPKALARQSALQRREVRPM